MIAAEVAQVAQAFGELRGNVLVLNDNAWAAWDGGTKANVMFRVCVRRWLRAVLITKANPQVTITAPTSRVVDVVTSANIGDQLIDGLVTP